MGSNINIGKNNYREDIIHHLFLEGYDLEEKQDDNSVNSKIISNEIKEFRDSNYQIYCQEISNSKLPSKSELKELNKKISKTTKERIREKKGNLAKRYGIEVTPKLVENDDKGWHSKLVLQYYFTDGQQYLAKQDLNSLNKILESPQGKAFIPDINKTQLSIKIKALEMIGIRQFFNPEAEFSKDSLEEWYQNVLQYRSDIKSILGVNINPNHDSVIAVAQRFLGQFGLHLEYKHQIRINGKPTRIYQGCNLNPDERLQVFQYWLEQDSL